MKTMLVILLIIVFLALIVLTYVLIRNEKVFNFREYIRECIYENYNGDDYFQIRQTLYDKYSYDDLLYSIKPLKLEYWYTEEEIKVMKGE